MDRQYYLNLITDTYFNTKNPVASEPAEPMFDLQIKLFREILVRKQKVAEREDFVTKDEFLLQCALALDHIKEYTGMQISFEISRLHDERESTRTFWFDESGSVQDIPKSVVEDDMLRTQNKIDDFDENNFLVDLSGLGGIIKGEICNYDVMLIEEVLKIFNVETDQPQQLGHETFNLSNSTKTEQTYTPKPCFKLGSIEEVTKDLNSFFDASQHAELKRIIKTGSNTSDKLLFRDNGNRLSDYFKRLFEKDTITGCDKKDLIQWIVKNFKYAYRKTQKEFIYKTVEKTISGDQNPCKNPIT